MKTLNKILLLLLVLFSTSKGYSQYHHSFYTDYSIIGNGVQTEAPFFKANEFGALMGGIASTSSGMFVEPGPLAICAYPSGNTTFNFTYKFSSCGTPIMASSGRIEQINHLGVNQAALVSTFQVPDDGCNMYTNSQSGVVQPGYTAGGVLYQALKSNGWPLTQKAYVWMTNNIPTWDVYDLEITDIQKAVNSPANNDVYVVGNLRWGYEQRAMFAFKFDASGNAIWHKTYAMGYGFSSPNARGIIQSPYNPNDVYIVGDIDQVYQGVPANDGFIMTVDANSGAVLTNNIYDIGNMDGFKAITVSDDPVSPGFALCGFSHTNSGTQGKYWVVKTDQSLNIQWSKTYTELWGSFDFCEANAIKGRYSSTNNRYEYYVAGKKGFSSSDAMVLKLDSDGNPINTGASGGSLPSGAIFIYDHNAGEYAVSVDATNVAGGAGEGLGVFCYHNDNIKTNVLLVHSYFNGYAMCGTYFYDADVTDELTTYQYLWAGDNDDWMEYDLQFNGANFNSYTPDCYISGDPLGSNAKSGNTTTVNSVIGSETEIELVPNPATDYLTVKNVTSAKFVIINSIGQEIYSGNIEKEGSDIDISKLQPGVYFITVMEKTRTNQLKFVKK